MNQSTQISMDRKIYNLGLIRDDQITNEIGECHGTNSE